MELICIPAENYADAAKLLPVPVIAFGVCTEDNPDVLLVYEELEEAA